MKKVSKVKKAQGLNVISSTMVAAGSINPVAYNPNKMSPAKYEALKESIRVDGFIVDLVLQVDGLNLIGGHHRLRAIKELCSESGQPLPDIPCKLLDVDDVTAKKLNLKLNHIGGEPDARLLGEVLADIYPEDKRLHFEDEVSLLGIEKDQAMRYIRIIEPESFPTPEREVSSFGKSVTLSLEFTSVVRRDQIKALLQQRVELEKKKSGDIIADILAPKKSRAKMRATNAA